MVEAAHPFVAGGRIPWTRGYAAYKRKLIEDTLRNPEMMERFHSRDRLPRHYGERLDERVVEYPWVFSRLDREASLVLDAGSTLNKEFLVDGPSLQGRRVIIYTLATDWITLNPNISYIFGDLRDMLLQDSCVDAITCISTLEHVGMGQDSKAYSAQNLPANQDLFGYRRALQEFRRVLKPGGQFLLTVPFGRRENHGWLQQFDAAMLQDVIRSFGEKPAASTYYLYRVTGWQTAEESECSEARYHNVHERKAFDPDYAAAARAVACLEFRKSMQ